jgi:hypothetical protein
MNSKKEKKIFDQNQLDDECVEDLVHQDAWVQFIDQVKGRKMWSNGLGPW